MTTEKIIADAEVAAIYFRALLANGVPAFAAVSLTSSYVSTKMMNDANREPPKEPWQEP